jgi:DNA-binding SARP family transcriptional activator
MHQATLCASSSEVSLSLLGGFELCVDGSAVSVPLGTRKVVAFLALCDRPVNRVFVAGNLWLDKSDGRAAANLRSALWRLPHVATPIVRASGSDLSLSDRVAVDSRRVAGMARGEFLDVAADRAILTSGTLLPDWTDEWLVIERERLRHLQLSALERNSETMLAQGDAAAAIDVAWSAIGIEPLRESAHRCVVRALLAAGNVAAAVRHYGFFASVLGEELGLTPTAAMQDLVHGLPGTGAALGAVTTASARPFGG